MDGFQGLWFKTMWHLSTAWQWLRNLTNWKAFGLAVAVYFVFDLLVWHALFGMVFGIDLHGIFRTFEIVINVVVLMVLFRYFERKYPWRRSL